MTKYRIQKTGGLGFEVLDLGPLQAQAQALQTALEAALARIAALEAQPVAKPASGAYDPAGTAAAAVAAHEAAADPHSGYLTAAEGAAAYAPLSHVGAGGGAHANASGSAAGFMSAADFTKLADVATGATANSTDAALRDRSTHTGTQASSTISDFSEAVDDRVAALLVAGSGISLTYNDAANTLTVAATGGADPWTYLVLGSDFTTSSATAVAITGLAFTPDPNARYEFEAVLMTRTATATVGPRPGIAWPTPTQVDGVGFIQQTSAAGTNVLQNGHIAAATLAPVGGLPDTTNSWPAIVRGIFTTGATVTLGLRLQLASETGGTNVTVRAGSFLKYRAY